MANARRVIESMASVMLRRAIRKSQHRSWTSAYGSFHGARTSIENTCTVARKSAGSTRPRNFNNRLWIAVLVLAVSFSAVSCYGFCQPVFHGLQVLGVLLYGEWSPMG